MGRRSRNQQHNNPAKMNQSQEQNSNHVTGNKRRKKQEEEEREKREIKKGKEGKKTIYTLRHGWRKEGQMEGKDWKKHPFIEGVKLKGRTSDYK